MKREKNWRKKAIFRTLNEHEHAKSLPKKASLNWHVACSKLQNMWQFNGCYVICWSRSQTRCCRQTAVRTRHLHPLDVNYRSKEVRWWSMRTQQTVIAVLKLAVDRLFGLAEHRPRRQPLTQCIYQLVREVNGAGGPVGWRGGRRRVKRI